MFGNNNFGSIFTQGAAGQQLDREAGFYMGLEGSTQFPETTPQQQPQFLQQEQTAQAVPNGIPGCQLEAFQFQQHFQSPRPGQPQPSQVGFLQQERFNGEFPHQLPPNLGSQHTFPFRQEEPFVFGQPQAAHHFTGQGHYRGEAPRQPFQGFCQGTLPVPQDTSLPLEQGHLPWAAQSLTAQPQQFLGRRDGVPVIRGIEHTKGLIPVKLAPQARRKPSKVSRAQRNGKGGMAYRHGRSQVNQSQVDQSQVGQHQVGQSVSSPVVAVTEDLPRVEEGVLAFVQRTTSETLEVMQVYYDRVREAYDEEYYKRQLLLTQEHEPVPDWEFAAMAHEIQSAADGYTWNPCIDFEG